MKIIMKKILMILFVATLVSCGGGSSTEEVNNDTTEVAAVDTGAVDVENITISEENATTLTEADSSATE
jgi:hypothetical protein